MLDSVSYHEPVDHPYFFLGPTPTTGPQLGTLDLYPLPQYGLWYLLGAQQTVLHSPFSHSAVCQAQAGVQGTRNELGLLPQDSPQPGVEGSQTDKPMVTAQQEGQRYTQVLWELEKEGLAAEGDITED